MHFNNDSFVVKQNNHATELTDAYITHDLDAWSITQLKNVASKTCLFIVDVDYHLMEQVRRVLLIILLEIL